MADKSKSGARPEKNIVHQNAIMGEFGELYPFNPAHTTALTAAAVETIHKEERHQKLFTEFSINPHKASTSITGKPNMKVENLSPDRMLHPHPHQRDFQFSCASHHTTPSHQRGH